MRRRPWPIVILAAIQAIVEPLSNLGLNSHFSHVSPFAYLAYFIEHHDWLNLFYMLGLPPLMGIAAYAMKRWSYYVFVAGATWALLHNFELVHDGSIPLTYAIALYIGNVGFVSYFLIPQVHAPYMNPRLRWWETKTRYLVDWACRVTIPVDSNQSISISCRVRDFSEGGVMILAPEKLNTEKPVELRMNCVTHAQEEILAIQAVPVFHRPTDDGIWGYGLQFLVDSKDKEKKVRSLARTLAKGGTPDRNGTESGWLAFKRWFVTLMTTGEGLIPPSEKKPAPTSSSSDDRKAS